MRPYMHEYYDDGDVEVHDGSGLLRQHLMTAIVDEYMEYMGNKSIDTICVLLFFFLEINLMFCFSIPFCLFVGVKTEEDIHSTTSIGNIWCLFDMMKYSSFHYVLNI